MLKIKRIKNPVPWLLALGFGLLYLSTLISSQEKATELISSQNKAPESTLPFQKSQERKLENAPLTTEADEGVLLTRVVDGDTIEITGGIRVRYIGIDTPEAQDCLGNDATAKNTQLLINNKIKIESDVEKYDKYGRHLAYVFAKDILVNEELVRVGLATVTTYPPNVKYVDRFLSAQKEAKEQKLGVWSDNPCPSPLTSQPSTPITEPGVQGAETGCLIKGNISSSGEKIYHVPGQRYYEKTKIEEAKGERWFCTEEEAVSSGWRKSKV